MGTPDFAVASLEALLKAGYPVIAVVTAADKPAGRGMQLTQSAVKKFAVANGLPVLQPEKLRQPEFLAQLQALQADLQVVVAFRMLPELVWDMPPMGTINVHGSLLPQYRGAAPINWAVINGEKETGVTTFKLQHQIDTGNILLQQSFPIGPSETAGEIHDRMKIIGAELLVKTVDGIVNGTIPEQPQPSAGTDLKHAPKLFSGTAQIDWNNSVESVFNLVRGLSPFPAAYTLLDGKMLKIFRAEKEKADTIPAPGTVLTDYKTYLKYSATDGWLSLVDIQLEGKKRMPVTEFLKGYRP